MSHINLSKLGCRHCRHYQQQGRRGGHCLMLGVAVQGAWKACPLVFPPFAPSWEHSEMAGESLKYSIELSRSPAVRQESTDFVARVFVKKI
ncbi:MAG: hypothetical protein MUE44_15335 [Oscillatoriaceae cyanobacterium Prado104]|nr:hypothetical protein [Oscillatoriaceae cyanobacterium Prado104]